MNILMIDNHDSFTYNLVHYMESGRSGVNVIVTQPEKLYEGMVEQENIAGIVISPGPSHPADHPAVLRFIRQYWHRLPVLGICLGHQMLWHMAGGSVERGARPVHGHVSEIKHDGGWLFDGLPPSFQVTRYHSLVCAGDVPGGFEVTARTEEGVVMGIRHKIHKAAGLQYHPEAVLSEHGQRQLDIFIETVLEGDAHACTREVQER